MGSFALRRKFISEATESNSAVDPVANLYLRTDSWFLQNDFTIDNRFDYRNRQEIDRIYNSVLCPI